MKFRNEPTMTWSSSDGDNNGGRVAVGDGDGATETDLCLHFDNVSLIELSRASTASGLHCHCGGGEKRSINGVAQRANSLKTSREEAPFDNGLSRSNSVLRNEHECSNSSLRSGFEVSRDFTAVVSSANGYGARSMSEAEPNANLQQDSNADDDKREGLLLLPGQENGVQIETLEQEEKEGSTSDEQQPSSIGEESPLETGEVTEAQEEDGNETEREQQREEKEECSEQAGNDDDAVKGNDQCSDVDVEENGEIVKGSGEEEKKKKSIKSVRFQNDGSDREKPDGASSDEGVNQEGIDDESRDRSERNNAGNETEDDSPGDPPSPAPETPKIPKGILKRPGKEKHKNRVTFNELMTVFADGYPEVQVPAFRPWDLTDILCFAYEPPPGYRDWDSFDPPAEYMDLVEASMGVTTFHGDEDDLIDSTNEGGEMIEIYRTEFEYSADAVEEMIFDGSCYMSGAGLENDDRRGQVTSFITEESPTEEIIPVNTAELETDPVQEEESGNTVTKIQADVDCKDDAIESDEDLSVEDSQNDNHTHYGAVTDNEDSGPETDVASGDEPSSADSAIEKPRRIELEKVEKVSEKDAYSGDELEDDEVDSTSSKNVSSTTSQIRKSIEMNALRRSLLRGSDVCRRRTAGPSQRPKSPTTTSLEEKLRWLTSTEDLSAQNNNNYTQNEEQTIPEMCEKTLVNEPTPITLQAAVKTTLKNPEISPSPVKTVPPTSHRDSRPHPQPTDGPHIVFQPRPTRWASELLYSSSSTSSASNASLSSSSNSSYDTRPQLPSFRPPPSRPSSFDPTLGTLAWEGYLQRDRYGCGGSSLSLMRAPYVCTVERHPNAAVNCQGGPGGAPRLKDPANPTSDELEWFVQRDLERIERIKKRYSLTEEDDPTFGFGRRPSVRGIRPRFGSTSEILQQLQSQMRPPRPMPLGHPKGLQQSGLPNSSGTPHQHVGPFRPNFPPGHPGEKLCYTVPHRVQHVQPGAHHRTVVVLPRVNEEGGPVSAIVRLKSKEDGTMVPNGGPCVNTKHYVISGPSKDERGAPEGASSSPKVSSDSLYPHYHHHHQQQQPQQHQQQPPGSNSASGQPPKEGIIYYSLRV